VSDPLHTPRFRRPCQWSNKTIPHFTLSNVNGRFTTLKAERHSLSEGVEAAEDVVGQLAAGDGAVALTLRQSALAALGQLRRQVVARSVLHERLAGLFPARFRRAPIQRLVFQYRQQTPDCTPATQRNILSCNSATQVATGIQ